MKIGEVARAAGVSTSRIRFYEAEGVIEPAGRTANGYRDYPPATVDLIVFIERAQKLGFSLREIQAGGVASAPHPGACDALLPPLRAKLADVEAHIAASTALRDEIAAMIVTLEAGEGETLRARVALAG
ncbi:putative transcriptional regulator [Caulobacter sp. AP07]|uniref:MerR family transcriptional regulator n=1 Tax=Caulobacter sp. AP07 TaxID=1144304 RepID=UPI000271DEF7|nr:MerR family transcriptional regulator [Caulobacter sp. AP07]EJL31000.1 putative transcriptional regulator [Caulobacter sp. AP07]